MRNLLPNLKDLAIGIVLVAIVIGIFYFVEQIFRSL